MFAVERERERERQGACVCDGVDGEMKSAVTSCEHSSAACVQFRLSVNKCYNSSTHKPSSSIL